MTQAAIAAIREALQQHHREPDASAARALQRLVGDNLDHIADDFATFADGLTLSLSLRDVALARSLTRARFPRSQIDFAFADDWLTQAEHHVRWTAFGAGTHRITLNPSFLMRERGLQPIIGNRISSVLPLVDHYDAAALGSGSAVIDLGDWSAGVGLCFCDNRFDALLVPDCSFLGSHGYRATRRSFGTAPSWEQREPRAIWRGSSTGTSASGLMGLPRVALCRIGRQREDIIDGGITSVVQSKDAEDAKALRDSGLCRDFVSMPDHARFKFQIDIDGNTNSWPGLFQKFLSGSVVLKVTPQENHRQWYYPRLRPWENFVPVRSDMADLTTIIDFLRDNDDTARRIGAAGRTLAESMTMERELALSRSTIQAAFDRDRWLRKES